MTDFPVTVFRDTPVDAGVFNAKVAYGQYTGLYIRFVVVCQYIVVNPNPLDCGHRFAVRRTFNTDVRVYGNTILINLKKKNRIPITGRWETAMGIV